MEDLLYARCRLASVRKRGLIASALPRDFSEKSCRSIDRQGQQTPLLIQYGKNVSCSVA